MSVDIGVHPAQRRVVLLGPEQSVGLHRDFAALARQIALEDSADYYAVLFPHGLLVGPVGYVLLQVTGHQKRSLDLGGAAEQPLLLVGYQVVEYLLEQLAVIEPVEREPRKRNQSLAQQPGIEPRIARVDFLAVVVVGYQGVGAAAQLVPVARYLTFGLDPGGELALEGRRFLLPLRSREDHRCSGLERQFEPSGDQQVLHAVIPAPALVGIGDVVVPARRAHETSLGIAQLEVEVGEVGIHPERHAVLYLRTVDVSGVVLVRQVMDVAESQERLERQLDGRRRLQQLVLDEQLVSVMGEEKTLAQQHLPHLIGDLRDAVGVEVHNVLVSSGFIGLAIAVNAEVELLAVHGEAFVQRGKEHEPVATETVERHGEEAVVAPGVASQNRSVAIRPRLVRADDLPLQRISQVHKLRLVEF